MFYSNNIFLGYIFLSLCFHVYNIEGYKSINTIFNIKKYNSKYYSQENTIIINKIKTKTALSITDPNTATDLSIELQKYVNQPAITLQTNDIQNILLIISGISFYIYEKRPRGSSRDDLIEVRKSLLIPNNLGVFSKAFISEGTLLGVYPGYIRDESIVFSSKQDEKAIKSAKRYIWMTSDGDMIDPTNSRGSVDLELSYMNGLVKVSTTLARINEPPINQPGVGVNCYTKVMNKAVAIYAERNIFSDEELFIDYGTAFDRSDYIVKDVDDVRGNINREAAARIREKEAMSRIQPVVLDDLTNLEDVMIDQSTSNPDGFLNKLVKSEAKYKNNGIISPLDGSRMFTEKGDAMFANEEDQELLNSMLGKKTATTTASSSSKKINNKKSMSSNDDNVDKVDSTDKDLLESMFKQMGSKAAASSDEIADITKIKDTNNNFIPTSSPSFINNNNKDIDNNNNNRNSDDDLSEEQGGMGPLLSQEDAEDLQKRLDDLTDEQVEKVFEKLKNTLGNKIQDQIAMKKSLSGKVNMPKAPAMNEEVRKEYAKEFNQIENELEKLYNNPLNVWQEILKNPEKFLDDMNSDESAKNE